MIHKSSNNRISYSYVKETRHDDFKYSGFDYEGKQIKKSISPYILRIPILAEFVEELEKMIFYLTEKAKMIPRWRNYAMDSRHTKFR